MSRGQVPTYAVEATREFCKRWGVKEPHEITMRSEKHMLDWCHMLADHRENAGKPNGVMTE